MAPELVRRLATDERLDVFALGVTAFEICTGELPFPTNRGGGMAAMSHNLAPSDIVELRPQIHPDLAKAIQRCMEADPANRCPSMGEFIQMIRHLEHEDAE